VYKVAELPQVIPRGQASSIASYDFIDLASGLGFQVYYAISGGEGQTQTYVLSPEQLRSTITYTQRTGAGTTTVNFDTSTFNLPRTVKGVAIFSGDWFSGTTEAKRLTVKLQKIDINSVVTDVSSAVSTYAVDGALNVNAGMNTALLRLPITQTTVKKGEKLRLNILMIVDTGTGAFEIGHDGANRNGSSINLTTYPTATTITKIFIPFRVDTT